MLLWECAKGDWKEALNQNLKKTLMSLDLLTRKDLPRIVSLWMLLLSAMQSVPGVFLICDQTQSLRQTLLTLTCSRFCCTMCMEMLSTETGTLHHLWSVTQQVVKDLEASNDAGVREAYNQLSKDSRQQSAFLRHVSKTQELFQVMPIPDNSLLRFNILAVILLIMSFAMPD